MAIKYLTYKQARTYVRALNLKSYKEWIIYVQTTIDQPNHVNSYNVKLPHKPVELLVNVKTYYTRNGTWQGWPDFLGVTKKKCRWWPYEQSREYVRKLKLKNTAEWFKWHDKHKPRKIPKNPDHYLARNTWVDWADFLGTNNKYSLRYKDIKLPLMLARSKVHAMYFDTPTQYNNWWMQNRPLELPRHAHAVYSEKGWGGWPDFLGTSIYSRMHILSIDISVVYIAQYPSYPGNVYEVSIDPKGEHEVYEKVKAKGGTIVRIFENDKNYSSDIKRIMQKNCSAWWEGGHNVYVVQNIYQLISDFGLILKWINTKPTYR